MSRALFLFSSLTCVCASVCVCVHTYVQAVLSQNLLRIVN